MFVLKLSGIQMLLIWVLYKAIKLILFFHKKDYTIILRIFVLNNPNPKKLKGNNILTKEKQLFNSFVFVIICMGFVCIVYSHNRDSTLEEY